MASDPVLMHARNAVDASKKYGIPASVILGVLSVEGGTSPDGRPVAPGDGLGPPSYGQFTTGTGASLGIKYGDSRSETFGVARYLSQLGYSKDPERAIGAYNGGPGNPQPAYAAKVEAAAKHYLGFDDGTATAPSSSVNASAGASAGSSSGAAGSTFARVGLIAALVLAAVVMIAAGAARATGLRGSAEQLARQLGGAAA
jgi:hypothetical protein